jgi:hypothetical protein
MPGVIQGAIRRIGDDARFNSAQRADERREELTGAVEPGKKYQDCHRPA